MRPRRLLAALVGLLLAGAGVAYACMGTPTPNCGRSIFLAKVTPGTLVVRTSRAITVPINLLPFVTWNTNPLCAQPVSASLSIRLVCVPVAGGPSTTFGPFTVARPTPTIPGPQPLPGPFVFTIPAGSIPAASLPQVCTVIGSYTVTFGSGLGTGTIVGTGDTEVCLVQPAPRSPRLPRLEVRYLSPTDTPFSRLRRGDQSVFHFLIANNDPRRSVTLNLLSEGRQTARLPDGFTRSSAYAGNVFAISEPEGDHDTYGAAFADELDPCELITEPDPSTPDRQRLTRTLTLGPLTSTIVPIAMRSYGMCADGSCNERSVKVQGTFSDGSRALGCAGAGMLVQTVAPRSPLCEFLDRVAVSPTTNAIFRPALYGLASGPFPHASTFAVGNQPPALPVGFQLTGALRMAPGQVNFPETSSEYLRLTRGPTHFGYSVDAFPQSANGSPQVTNNVLIDAGQSPSRVELPLIKADPLQDSFFDVFYHVSLDSIRVIDRERNRLLYQGRLTDLVNNPPPGLATEAGTSRIFIKSGSLEAPCLSTDPLAIVRRLRRREVSRTRDTVNLTLTPPNTAATWDARIIGRGVKLVRDTGPIGTPIEIRYASGRLSRAPNRNIAYLVITTTPPIVQEAVIVPISVDVVK